MVVDKQKLTMKEIAAIAGVSLATVSRVLNNADRVSPELAEKVFKAISATGYRPNVLARGLKTGFTKTIGIIITDLMNPFYASVVNGIESAADKLGFNIFLASTNRVQAKQLKYMRAFKERWVDGIIMTPAYGALDPQDMLEMRRFCEETPVVMLNQKIPGIAAGAALVDNFGLAYLPVQHLIEHGHTRIGFLSGPLDTVVGQERLRGFCKAFQDHGLAEDESLIRMADFKIEPAIEETISLLKMSDPPTALYISNSLMAIGALRAIRSLGKDIPGDVAMVVSDDPEWVQFLDPPLTAMALPTHELGVEAVNLLEKRIRGQNMVKDSILGGELRIRKSCGCN